MRPSEDAGHAPAAGNTLNSATGMVALSLPCVVGAAGAERQLRLPMSAQEQTLLQRSAAILDQAYRSLNPGSSATGPTTAATDLATKTSADP